MLTISVVYLLCGAMALRLADRLEWSVKRCGFERVVKMVESGQLKTNRDGRISMRENLRWLGQDGKWTISFATQKGFNGVQGYVYCAGAERPVVLGGENVRVLFQPASHWFYCEFLEENNFMD